ncbi:MAG: hypothetical protein ACXABY_28970 [Candidatus Thorarchaeota archaeon]|jgi:hypothetical protein
MGDKETLLELIGILKEVREDAKTIAALRVWVKVLGVALAALWAAFWGYILVVLKAY